MNYKVAIVTGVGPGTGKAVVERFAAAGYRVAMIARSEQRLAEIAGETANTVAFPCDVTDGTALDSALSDIGSRLGTASVVVHNAVGAERGTYMDVDLSKMRQAFEVNTMALLALAQRLIPDMEAAGGGALICTAIHRPIEAQARLPALRRPRPLVNEFIGKPSRGSLDPKAYTPHMWP